MTTIMIDNYDIHYINHQRTTLRPLNKISHYFSYVNYDSAGKNPKDVLAIDIRLQHKKEKNEITKFITHNSVRRTEFLFLEKALT